MKQYTCTPTSQSEGGKQEVVKVETGQPLSLTTVGETTGPRRVFDDVADWVEVKGAGNLEDAGPEHKGIFTRGQTICLAVVLIDWDGTQWTRARMLHIGNPNNPLLTGKPPAPRMQIGSKPQVTQSTEPQSPGKDFYAGYTGIDADRLWVVVLSKVHLNNSTAATHVKAKLTQLRDDHIWLYHGDALLLQMQSAVSRNGLLGEPPPK